MHKPLHGRVVTTVLVTLAMGLAAGCTDASGPAQNATDPTNLRWGGGYHLIVPASVTVTIDSATLAPTHTATANAVAKDKYGRILKTLTVYWQSSDTTIAKIVSTGLITARKAGSVTIRAWINGVIGTASLTVVDPVVSSTVAAISVKVDSTTITVPHSGQAAATLLDNSGHVTSGTVSWRSSDTAVAKVSSTGAVSAVASGTASIVASSGTVSGSASLTVKATTTTTAPAVASISVTLDSTTLTVPNRGQAAATLRDSAGNVMTGTASWSSSNTAVATVSSTGAVTALAAGTTSIVATSGTVTGSATLSVKAPSVASVSVKLGQASINVGATTQATATTFDANNNVLTGRVVSWSSSNAAIASVNSSTGLVTGVAAGTASIIATSEGKSGSATITIASVLTATSSTAGLSGSIASTTGGAAGGGFVEVLSGSTVLQRVAVSSSGTYSVSGLAAGTYGVRLQPSLAYSMGPAEPAQRSVSIVSGAASTQNFTVQPAVWWDDFQSYTSSSQLTAGCSAPGAVPPAGTFFAGTGHLLFCSSPSQIVLDNGGPGGTKAMRYDWPGATKPSSMTLDDWCKNNEYTVRVSPFWSGSAIQSFDTLWVRFSTKESSGFVNGATSCMSSYATAYKWFLVDIGSASDPNGRIGTYLFSGNTIYADMYDQSGADLRATQSSSLPSATYPGQWHTWHIQIFNMGTSSATYRVYVDGVVLTQIVGPFYPGQLAASVSRLTQMDVGANINNQPELPQSRWWREIGVYHTRPSMLPIGQ